MTRCARRSRGYTIEDGQLARLPGAPILADDELTGLCGYTSAITGRVYALGMTDSGEMLQWELFAKGGALEGRLVRSVALGKGVEYCVVDDASGTMYYGDEALGVMSLPVEPGNRSGAQDRRPRRAARRDHRRGQGHRTRARRGRQGAPHRVRHLVGAFLCL